MLASGSLLAQVRPADMAVATLFTATLATEVTLIIVANTTASAATFRLFHAADGSTFTEATAIYWDVSVAAGESFVFSANVPGAGIQMGRAHALGVRVNTASALTISAYGVTEKLAERVRN